MDNSLAKQFSNFLPLVISTANQIVKQAHLNYPPGLISSWENILATSNPGFVHPLDAVDSPNNNIDSPCQQLEPDLRVVFKNKIMEYCNKNKIDIELPDKIVELVFDNFEPESGKIILPDLTSNEPTINFFTTLLRNIQLIIQMSLKPLNVEFVLVIDHFLRILKFSKVGAIHHFHFSCEETI